MRYKTKRPRNAGSFAERDHSMASELFAAASKIHVSDDALKQVDT